MKRYINEEEVARITGLAIQTLRNWRHQKRVFPYTKISRSIRYDLDDIVAFMEKNKVRTIETN